MQYNIVILHVCLVLTSATSHWHHGPQSHAFETRRKKPTIKKYRIEQARTTCVQACTNSCVIAKRKHATFNYTNAPFDSDTRGGTTHR